MTARWDKYAYVLAACCLVTLGGCGGGISPPQMASGPVMRPLQSGSVDYLAWFEYPGNPVAGPASELSFSCVLYENGSYVMWSNYGYGGIWHSTSSDGMSWTSPAACSGLSSTARHCQVIYNPDLGQYEIWYY